MATCNSRKTNNSEFIFVNFNDTVNLSGFYNYRNYRRAIIINKINTFIVRVMIY